MGLAIHDELDNIGVLNDLHTYSSGGRLAPIINLEGTQSHLLALFYMI